MARKIGDSNSQLEKSDYEIFMGRTTGYTHGRPFSSMFQNFLKDHGEDCTMFDMAQVSYAFKTIYLGVVFINNSVCKQTSGCGIVCLCVK